MLFQAASDTHFVGRWVAFVQNRGNPDIDRLVATGRWDAPGAECGLRSISRLEFVQDMRHVVLNGFEGHAKGASDLVVACSVCQSRRLAVFSSPRLGTRGQPRDP